MHPSAKKQLESFLLEDIGKGDITSNLLPKKNITATIISRQEGIVAGVAYGKQIFKSRGCSVTVHKRDGQTTIPNQKIMTVSGKIYSVLSCERTALNLMSRMSGIATETRKYVKKVHAVNSKVDVFSTRKTAPGLRIFDKEAVSIGGGQKHRMSLDQMVMIKDNHIAASDSLSELIKLAKTRHKKIEVEVENLQDAVLAASQRVHTIMLDNMSPNQIRAVIKKLTILGLRRGIRIEASGGINYSNIAKYASTGVDMISIGKLTSSVNGLDLSLEVNL